MRATKLIDSRTILVVEDEELVGLFLCEALSDAGFAVTHFSEARPALQVLEQTRVCAAIVDIGLPDFMGDELARLIRTLYPTLPIVLTTGFDHTRYEAQFGDDPWVRVMSKPFDEPALLMKLEALQVRASIATVSPSRLPDARY